MSAKISASSSITWLTGWTEPRGASGAGKREIERLAGELRFERRAFERLLANGQRFGHRLAQRVDLRAFGLALFGRHRAKGLEQAGDAALLAEIFDAQGFERGKVFGPADARKGRALECFQFSHCATPLGANYPAGQSPAWGAAGLWSPCTASPAACARAKAAARSTG